MFEFQNLRMKEMNKQTVPSSHHDNQDCACFKKLEFVQHG